MRLLPWALVLAGVLVATGPAGAGDQPQVTWRTDFELGLEEAVVLRRPLLITFYTDWCGWCRKLERSTFRDPQFVEMTESSLIPVRVNGDEQRGLAAMFQVRGYPTTIVLSRRGSEIGRVVGYQAADPFLRNVYAALGKREPYEELVAQAESDPDDPEAQYFLGDMFLALGRFPEARQAFDRVLDLDADNVSELADDAYLDRSLATYLSGFPEQAATQLEEFARLYPASDRADQGLFFQGMFLIEAGEQDLGEVKLREAAARTNLEFIRSQAVRLADEE